MKKLLVLLFTITMSFTVFAQTIGGPTGLTDSDVIAYAQNYEKIYAELATEEAMQNYQNGIIPDGEMERITKILNKYGITGSNANDKFNAITNGYTALMFEQASSSSLSTSLMMKALPMDPSSTLKMMVHDQDLAVIKRHMKELNPAFGNSELNSDPSFTATAPEVRKNTLSQDELTEMLGAGLGKSVYGAMNSRDKKYIKEKYNTKMKFKLSKTRRVDYIVIQPEEITFENSEDAELYPMFYTGATGQWEICNNYGYLGTNNNNEPFYTWVKGGVAYYSTFPVNEKTGNPDKFIPDSQVTPEIAEKTVLQMYRKAK